MFPCQLISRLSTHYVSQHPEACAYLSNSTGFCCHLNVIPLLSLEIQIHRHGEVTFSTCQINNADVTLTGSRQDFYHAAQQLQSGQNLMGQNIQIQGDMQKLQQLQQLLQQFDLHWTGILNAFIGPAATGMIQTHANPILMRFKDLYQDFSR